MIQEKSNDKKMIIVYDYAKSYLNTMIPTNINEDEFKKYFDVTKEFTSLKEITYGLFGSLQNSQMMPNVIGLWKKNRANVFAEILFDFDCNKIIDEYDETSLYSLFCDKFTVNNKESKGNLWRRYTRYLLSAAKFMTAFESADDFDKFIMRFDYNELTSTALPMLLKAEILGLGFPLACDFLKELGYSQYPKPDVHIIEIFSALNFCDKNDYEVYKAVIKMAKINNDNAYNVDKIFWLIGSGSFYLHDIKVGSHKADFIRLAQNELALPRQ